ncbi:phosphoadenosine phosphosulfate reductase [Hungatella effluvii]|uniref:Phosphoadenosine phosphosulfate reductase n=1 Tax=Hungatella effluvii TaxID=1096246 RepID=A0A2V3Y4A7_9FIRM|nr:phosphoadenosine phosphosulfate reductase family protein [Hungatella effluvii]PXX51958.1 phosphoadenosine phosphosulfate reductase [Hungatella effluvii]
MEQLYLFEIEKKMKDAVELLNMCEPAALAMNPAGFYLAFSGGKDSLVIYHLAKMAGVRFEAHYHLTTVDPPELVHFIRRIYPDVIIDYPPITMWNLIIKKQLPPYRNARYCCSVLKETGGEGRFVITGVRWQESRKRESRGAVEVLGKRKPDLILNNDNEESRRIIENCQLKGKRIINPIISWTENEVWLFIYSLKISYCELYDCGFRRLGCIGCPLASVKNREWEFKRYPKYREAYIRTFDRMVEARRAAGKTDGNWRNGEAVFNWWMYGNPKREKQVEGQMELDYDVEAFDEAV